MKRCITKITEIQFQNTYGSMPRLTRAGNYYCRQEPPKARVWDDGRPSNGNVGGFNHVFVTDKGGIINGSSFTTRARSSSSASQKTMISLEPFSKVNVKEKLQRSFSLPHSYKRRNKEAKNNMSMSLMASMIKNQHLCVVN